MSKYYKKYLKYKNKYQQLKNQVGGEDFIIERITDLPTDEDDIAFYSHDQLVFFNNIMHKPQFNHFPFVEITSEYTKSIKLDNNCRMDNEKFYDCLGDKNKQEFIKLKFQNIISWLYNNIWKYNWVHGDLTKNNIIFDAKTNEFIIIDWKGRSSFISNNHEFILSFMIDLYDLFNSFSQKFDFIQSPSILNNIKMYEIEINNANSEIIQYVLQTNIENIHYFLYDVLIVTGIDMNTVILQS